MVQQPINKDLYPQDAELTTLECADVAKLNRRTIVAWIHRGDLPATRRPGARGHYRVQWNDLYQVLRKPVSPKED
jgi:excisionase family DNA binding protein